MSKPKEEFAMFGNEKLRLFKLPSNWSSLLKVDDEGQLNFTNFLDQCDLELLRLLAIQFRKQPIGHGGGPRMSELLSFALSGKYENEPYAEHAYNIGGLWYTSYPRKDYTRLCNFSDEKHEFTYENSCLIKTSDFKAVSDWYVEHIPPEPKAYFGDEELHLLELPDNWPDLLEIDEDGYLKFGKLENNCHHFKLRFFTKQFSKPPVGYGGGEELMSKTLQSAMDGLYEDSPYNEKAFSVGGERFRFYPRKVFTRLFGSVGGESEFTLVNNCLIKTSDFKAVCDWTLEHRRNPKA